MANLITSLRIICSFLILTSAPFSNSFFVFYLICGLTDMIDGYVARKTKSVSAVGTLLDSVADFCFLVCVAIKVIPIIIIPRWLLILIGVIFLIRIITYIIGFIRFRKLASLHTVLNKLTGLALFISLIFYPVFGINAIGIIVGSIALLSAIEEQIIVIQNQSLEKDIRSIFSIK